MTRHSLGYLLSERAKAQKHHLAPVSKDTKEAQQIASEANIITTTPPSEQHPHGTDSVVIEDDNVPNGDQRNPGNTTQ